MRRQLADALGTEQTGGKSEGSAALMDQDRVQVSKKSALMCSSCSRSVVASPELLITFGECPECAHQSNLLRKCKASMLGAPESEALMFGDQDPAPARDAHEQHIESEDDVDDDIDGSGSTGQASDEIVPRVSPEMDGDLLSAFDMMEEAKVFLILPRRGAEPAPEDQQQLVRRVMGAGGETEMDMPVLHALPQSDLGADELQHLGQVLSERISASDGQTGRFIAEAARGQVVFTRLAGRSETARMNRDIMRAANTQAAAMRMLVDRILVVRDHAKEQGSVTNQVGVLNLWRQYTICMVGVSPYRYIWNKRRDMTGAEEAAEDSLMKGFVGLLSQRYDTAESVKQAMAHVVNFHLQALEVPAPPMPVTRGFLKLMELRMLKEVALRGQRDALLPVEVDAMVAAMLVDIHKLGHDDPRAKLLANVRPCLIAMKTQAFRGGELAVGDKKWTQRARGALGQTSWTRLTMDALQLGLEDGHARLVLPPRRKTGGRSRLTNEITHRPWPYVHDVSDAADFVTAIRLMESMDPVGAAVVTDAALAAEPAFRDPTKPGNPALSPEVLLQEIREYFEQCFPDLVDKRVIGDHSVRIGSSLAFAAAGATEAEQRAQGTWTGQAKALYELPLAERMVQLSAAAARVRFSVATAGARAAVEHSSRSSYPVITPSQLSEVLGGGTVLHPRVDGAVVMRRAAAVTWLSPRGVSAAKMREQL